MVEEKGDKSNFLRLDRSSTTIGYRRKLDLSPFSGRSLTFAADRLQ